MRYIETNNDKWKALRQFQKRELMKVGAFLGAVGVFTLYGYGNARQAFVRRKLEIVKDHSIAVTDQ